MVSIWVLEFNRKRLSPLELIESDHFLRLWCDKLLVSSWLDNLVVTAATETS